MAPRFERDRTPSGPVVQGFSGSRFVVDGERYDAVLLTPERAIAWNPPARAELTFDHFASILMLDPRPHFLLFGSGPTLGRLSRAVMAQIGELGIGVEAMDSRAAARTWGVLRAEERWIVAALMPL